MAENDQFSADFSKLFQNWTETAVKFWQDVGNQEQPFSAAAAKTDSQSDSAAGEDDKYRAYRSWENTWNTYISFFQLMMAPQNQDEIFKNASTLAETITQATEESLENFTEFQTELVRSLAAATQHTNTHHYSTIDHTTFESFREFYRTELQKYLHIPKIGLPRELHEHFAEFTDKSNIFCSHLAEFLYLLILPLEKSQQLMQKKIKQMVESGEISTDSKELYGDWIKVLEGQYMQLLKSSEYTDVLNNTIGSLAEYKRIKQELTNTFLKDLQIPTNSDMDEVYKELYTMKKKIRELSRKVEMLEKDNTS